MLRGSELLVGVTALAVAMTGAVTASTVGSHRTVVPAVEAASTVPLPSAGAGPSTRPSPQRLKAVGPVPAAPPQSGCPVERRPSGGGSRPLPAPTVAEGALPTSLPVRAKATDLTAVKGKGLWVTPFRSTPVDVDALLRKAKATHVRSLWIRTGGSRQGYYGDRFLTDLVAKAHASGLFVVAWDFPFLSDPVADARRAHAALERGIDAFSPDVETSAEGTHATPRRIALYLSLVRSYAGTRPVVATVPRPSDQRATYPYQAFVPYADVFAPMVYWSCREPGAVVQQSLERLGKLLPVAPVGQGYDMGPEGGRRGTPTRAETLRFLDVARRGGGLGASLWTVEEAGPAQLQALADYAWPS